jgi:transketolase
MSGKQAQQAPAECDMQELARRVRTHCLRMTFGGKSGHIGSMMSMVELMVVLYRKILRVDPKNPDSPQRDRFILSKGHAGGAVYATLAEQGFFPREWLDTYYKDNGKLSGHISHYVPGVEFSTGSLGHGLPVAVGMALAAKVRGDKHRIFCLMSDGDVDEGSTWEAIMFAAQHKLDNLIGIVDYNRIQALGHVKDVIQLDPLEDKFKAFGWSPQTVDGHDMQQIEDALSKLPYEAGKPSMLIANTVKGKGVSFMENTVGCHYLSVSEDQLKQALAEVGASS